MNLKACTTANVRTPLLHGSGSKPKICMNESKRPKFIDVVMASHSSANLQAQPLEVRTRFRQTRKQTRAVSSGAESTKDARQELQQLVDAGPPQTTIIDVIWASNASAKLRALPLEVQPPKVTC